MLISGPRLEHFSVVNWRCILWLSRSVTCGVWGAWGRWWVGVCRREAGRWVIFCLKVWVIWGVGVKFEVHMLCNSLLMSVASCLTVKIVSNNFWFFSVAFQSSINSNLKSETLSLSVILTGAIISKLAGTMEVWSWATNVCN